jgi:hypothetical protein
VTPCDMTDHHTAGGGRKGTRKRNQKENRTQRTQLGKLAGPNEWLEPTGAAILVFRSVESTQAAPAAQP